jgi:undecaprenyl-diphosphatase
MTLFQALLLGLIQGLTEFLPVSLSGHLAITQHFLPGFNQPGLLFDVLLYFGTMLAVAIYCRRELLRLTLAWFLPAGEAKTDRRIFVLLVLASVPTAIISLSFKDFYEQAFDNLPLIAAMLVVTGTYCFAANACASQAAPQQA